MKPKILVTGAYGFVGRAFVQRWASAYELLSPRHAELDITSDDSVQDYFTRHRPSIVLHLAALSNTGYCEQHPEESLAVNVLGTERIAKAAVACGAKLVFFSSDQIYNGNYELGALSEQVKVAPENHYGRHKLLAEQLALQASPDFVALRATWMYDREREGEPFHADFATNFEKAIQAQAPLTFAIREYRGITWLRDVVSYLPHTFYLPGGVYNYGAENNLNTYETACQFFQLFNCKLPIEQIVNADPHRFPEHVRNISISSEKIRQASNDKINFGNTLDGLRRYIDECKKHSATPV